jgi:formylglycine-generating enzyme required for sulfatase activity
MTELPRIDSTKKTQVIIRRQQGQAQYYTEKLDNEIGLDMISIPGGIFLMGSPENELERFESESPQHEVIVPNFYMGRYPITQAQWRVVAQWEPVERKLDPDPSHFKEPYEGQERWNRPVENVSWNDAKEFCARLSKRTKRNYRLPTEAEWEYACRAGTKTPFHFGETITTDLANYDGNSVYGQGIKGEYRQQTTPVGYFQVANAFGLYDMHGNVWEWCEDDWHPNYEGAPTDGSAWLSSNKKTSKVRRGGSWLDYPWDCRSAFRNSFGPGFRNGYIGFRVVRVAPRTP